MTAGAPIKLTTMAVLAASLLLGAVGSASAFETPPFKGNDTGGIIAYEYARQTDIRALASDHCGQYGKVPKFVSADRQYGGYVSFACNWVRPVIVVRTLY